MFAFFATIFTAAAAAARSHLSYSLSGDNCGDRGLSVTHLGECIFGSELQFHTDHKKLQMFY